MSYKHIKALILYGIVNSNSYAKERGQNGSSAIIHNRFQVIFARSKITKTSKEPAIPSAFEFSDKTFLTLNLCAYLWKLFHPHS